MFPHPFQMAMMGYAMAEMQCDAARDRALSHTIRGEQPCLERMAHALDQYRDEYSKLMSYAHELKKLYMSVIGNARLEHGIEYPLPPAGIITSIQARIAAVSFFEAGNAIPPKEVRSYGTRFPASETRYVWCEYNLCHIPPGRPIDYEVVCKWYHLESSRDTPFTSTRFSSRISANWEYSYQVHGCGWEEKGNWTPGRYGIQMFVEDEFVAQGSFEIY